MKRTRIAFLLATLGYSACSSTGDFAREEKNTPLTVIAIGDAGEKNGDLRGNARLINRMYTREHDGGVPDVLIFLGDNFYDTGLNVPFGEIKGEAESILGQFRQSITALGRRNVHAIPGNHDYYTRHAFSTSALFGLITVDMGPMGLSDKGNKREEELSEWTYYYNMPASVSYDIPPDGGEKVEFIFFDSARLLRTDPAEWYAALDSLTRLLRFSATRNEIAWRILAVHHPLYSVGEHGGYTVWDDETNSVEYLTQCDKDTNALGWMKNFLDPEDLCADRYRQFSDSLKACITRGGAKIHLILSGHDHSLQLLSYPGKDPDCPPCPDLHIVSGAGSRAEKVKNPNPPREFTAFDPKAMDGSSLHGFAQLMFEAERIRVVFFNGKRGEAIDMGGGKKEFWIDRNGELVE